MIWKDDENPWSNNPIFSSLHLGYLGISQASRTKEATRPLSHEAMAPKFKGTQSDSKWLYVLWLDVFLAPFDAAASGFWYILGTRMWWRIFTMMGAFGLALSISQEGAISLLGSSGAIWSLQRGWRMAEKVWKGDPAKVFNTYCISLAYCIPIHHKYIYSWLATATAFCVWANGQHNEGSRAKLTAKL